MSEIKIQHQYWQATDGCGVGLGSGSSMRGGHIVSLAFSKSENFLCLKPKKPLILCTCRHAEIEALIHIVTDDFKDTFAAPSQICLLKAVAAEFSNRRFAMKLMNQ
ncbi:unnamed protein product [Prunus armeniaca]|uniref:Uncharacterized protein n=1 Tax=Prunus armeniaca TaxID=36596 RepID=A0A6J5XTF4_PRUAR|nr:unnamed protein product [Prunus armeniaca]